MDKGILAERLEIPSCGASRRFRGVGGTRQPRLALGGNGKGGIKDLARRFVDGPRGVPDFLRAVGTRSHSATRRPSVVIPR